MLKNCILRFYEFLKTITIIINAVKRDIMGILYMIKIRRKLAYYSKQNMVTADIFREWTKKQPNKPCIIFYDKTWTFKDVNFIFL